MNAIAAGETRENTSIPFGYWVAVVAGLLWNIYGVVQFAQTVFASRSALMEMGMTQAQAELYANLPLWMNVAFAVGVLGGVTGCVLLLLRRKLATVVFAASLAGYLVLFTGDIVEGVFAAIGVSQVVILTVVVVIAGALLWLARAFERRGALELRAPTAAH